MGIVFTAIATLIVTVIAGLVLDYWKNSKPKVAYKVRDALPIDIDDKKIGAYLISVVNTSKKTIKDLSIFIEAGTVSLKNGGVSCPQGFVYDLKVDENKIKIDVPFFKENEEASFTVIAESPYYIPKQPNVAIRSPQQFKLIESSASDKIKRPLSFWLMPMVTSLTATAVAISVLSFDFIPRSQKDVLMFSASSAELPELVKIYAVSDDVKYYNQGDLAFSMAKQCKDNVSIMKYITFLKTTIALAPRMASGSKSNNLYNLAKIYLLIHEEDLAKKYFQDSIEESKRHVIDLIKYDSMARKFIYNETLLPKE